MTVRNNHVTFGPGLLSVIGKIFHNIISNSIPTYCHFTGDRHRKQRKMLNPVFSVAHLRHMGGFLGCCYLAEVLNRLHSVPTFFGVTKQVHGCHLTPVLAETDDALHNAATRHFCENGLQRSARSKNSCNLPRIFLSAPFFQIDMITWMTRAALEIVGQSGLGTSFSPVSDDHPEHPFIAAVKELGSVEYFLRMLFIRA